MILQRFYDDPLAQASFLIGCQATGEAIVVDPNRDAGQYIAAAEAEGLEIVAVTETHIHADFVSGTRELSERTGAKMYLSDAGPPEWQYGFRSDPRFVPITGGSRIKVGNVVIEAVHTPGHTPEHLSFFVTDGAASTEPMGILTGDFVFVGDVGRPDLLEKAAHVSGAADSSARVLFRSLEWFKGLPDHLQVWPGHGAGSACGKGIGAVPQSTVGYERRTNWGLAFDEEEAFVTQVLLGQPEPPRYFGVMKRINRDGPPLLGRILTPERISERRLASLVAAGAVLVDTRATASYATGFIPGTVNLPLGRSFATYAGSLLPYDQDIYLLVEGGPAAVDQAVRTLVSIGLDRVAGYLGPEAIEIWRTAGHPVESVDQVTVDDLSAGEHGRVVVDVRGASEWRAGHLKGSILVPLPELPDRLAEIPADRPVVLLCQTGSRSAVAASYLRSRGRTGASNLAGGMVAWITAGLAVER
ncbi:MAG: beta-lactamase domain protein [Gemmatimonadetes bacterium]|nr:beta-lactamase domain protein [Gemmatimonadota bacterium]